MNLNLALRCLKIKYKNICWCYKDYLEKKDNRWFRNWRNPKHWNNGILYNKNNEKFYMSVSLDDLFDNIENDFILYYNDKIFKKEYKNIVKRLRIYYETNRSQ